MFLVFKTTVDTNKKARQLKPHLDKRFYPAKWNFDLLDTDRILRVEADQHFSVIVVNILNSHGFDCIELD